MEIESWGVLCGKNSRKTGDFASLSATDIKVLALTYMLEVRHVGIDHLLSEPKVCFVL